MRKYTFEDSAVAGDLRYWGWWKGIQCAADGYAPESTIKKLLSGRGTAGSRHRVLCKDMPARAWEINGRVMCLPGALRLALFARYCLPVKGNGHPYNEHELATILNVSVRMYRALLVCAKARYKAMIFGQPLNLFSVAAA